jgi:hypothetical protein
MPDLQVNEGGFHRIYNNMVKSNNGVNFAARGSSVARVPGGTGAFVLAGHDIEFDHNTFYGNSGAALSVISYPLTGDPRVNGCDGSALLSYGYCAKMWPARVFIHDNTFTGNGSSALVSTPADCPDPTHPGAATDCPDPVAWQLGQMLFAMQTICYGPAGSNGSAYLLNLQFGTSGGSDFSQMTTDMAAYQCTLPAQALADADVTAKAP